MSNDFVKFIQDELSGYYKFTYNMSRRVSSG